MKRSRVLFGVNILLSPGAQEHANECQKIPIHCCNGCGKIIAREEVKTENSKIDCFFCVCVCS